MGTIAVTNFQSGINKTVDHMGFFEWYSNLQFKIRTRPWTAFAVGFGVAFVVSLIIVLTVLLATDDANEWSAGTQVGVGAVAVLGISLLVGGIMVFNSRMYQARVGTFEKQGFNEQQAQAAALQDARETETISAFSGMSNMGRF